MRGVEGFYAAGIEALHTATRSAIALLRPERPDRLLRGLIAGAIAGPTASGLLAAAAARYPGAVAFDDADGELSYAALWRRTEALAAALRDHGVSAEDTVGVLARNERTFVVAWLAAARLGCDVVFLNTGFAAPQLADVVRGERITVLLHADEFAEVVGAAPVAHILSGSDIEEFGSRRVRLPSLPSRRRGAAVILTSGTTGRPKGARRSRTRGGASVAGLLARIPIRARDTVVIAAPVFHGWGMGHLTIDLALSATIMVRARFDPEETVALVAARRAAGLVVVPVMLQRILELGPAVLDRYDTSSLRYIASSGSALGPALVTATLERFGPVLYNMYGTTEVSMATIATPRDLTAHPATAGRPITGSTVRILDEDGVEVPRGRRGRIFVGSAARMDGYTGGGTKPTVGDLLDTGDVGVIDDHGLLFVEGRSDDMIVSGGENVFPSEVEDLLAHHPAIRDVAVIGVHDDAFGQRLRAIVVRAPGHRLTAAQVKDHVRANLARHKVPATVSFVSELPRNATGKILRNKLT